MFLILRKMLRYLEERMVVLPASFNGKKENISQITSFGRVEIMSLFMFWFGMKWKGDSDEEIEKVMECNVTVQYGKSEMCDI